jgi:hypothetical protein
VKEADHVGSSLEPASRTSVLAAMRDGLVLGRIISRATRVVCLVATFCAVRTSEGTLLWTLQPPLLKTVMQTLSELAEYKLSIVQHFELWISTETR